MSDRESISYFHGRLKDICNTLYNLGDHVPETRIVKKIFKYLLDKFVPKITAIKESKVDG